VEHRPLTALPDRALSWAAVSIFFQLYLNPVASIRFSGSLTMYPLVSVFVFVNQMSTAVLIWQCFHFLFSAYVSNPNQFQTLVIILMNVSELNKCIGLSVDKPALTEGRREEGPRGICRSPATGGHLPHAGFIHRGKHCRSTDRYIRECR